MRSVRRGVCLGHWMAAPFVTLTLIAASARADEPLRWKFQAGQRLAYSVVQEMTISGAAGPASDLNNTTRQQMDIAWEVQSVNESGDAVIRQTFNRIRTKMTLPTGGLEFDSAAEGPPSGMAAINAPLYRALIKWPAELTVSARGQVKSVKVPDEVQEALKKVPTAAAVGDLASPEAFWALFLPGFPVLPDGAIEPGQKWLTKITAELPMAGRQTVETAYRYEGTREVDGRTLAVIKPARMLSFAGTGEARRAVKEQASEGEILFDPAGRLHSTMMKHAATIETTAGDRRAEQKIELTIEVTPAPLR